MTGLEGGYYAAGRFTAADVSIGYALLVAGKLGLGAQFPPEVAEYWERLSARGGYRRAQAAQAAALVAQDVPPADFGESAPA